MICIKKTVRFIFDVIVKCLNDGINAYSAHAAFFVTVSFIPFIMLLISLIGFLPLEESRVLLEITNVFPKGARTLVTSFITDAYEKSGTALMSVTAVTTLWAASIGVFSVVQGLNRVFCANETRNFIIVRFMSMIYTLIVMALLVLCLAVFVFGDTVTGWLSGFVPELFKIVPVIQSLRLMVGVLVLAAFFLVMYTVIPNRKVKLLSQLPGAVIGSVGWVGFSYVFSYYYENLANYSYVYGSLSVLVFFMLWLFICIYILFIGAEVNKILEDRDEHAVLFGSKSGKN